MSRQARLDAPGTLRHVMGRGIEGSEIFRSKKDRVGSRRRGYYGGATQVGEQYPAGI
jgi:hypothetical protein